VKTSRILALSVIGLLAFSATDLYSQQPPQSQPPQRQPIPGIGTGGNGPALVALVDFDRLLMNYVRSKYIRDQIRKDREAAETQIRNESKEVEKEKEKLREFKPGTPQFKAMEEQLAQKVNEINFRVKVLQRDFQEREQKALYQLYTEITEEVKRFADAKGIVLIMPYSSEPVDPNVPETMQRQMNKSFVYLNGPDVTEPILQELNRRAVHTAKAPGAGGGGQAPVNPNTRTR
jgi:Skp family chaperone for outer membrane proteins